MYNVAFDDNSKEASVLAFKTIQYPPFFQGRTWTSYATETHELTRSSYAGL